MQKKTGCRERVCNFFVIMLHLVRKTIFSGRTSSEKKHWK